MTSESAGCGSPSGQSQPSTAIPSPPHRFDVRRVYVALVFIPLFYLLVRYFPPAAFFGLVSISSLLAVAEFYRLYFRDHAASSRESLAAMGIGLVGTALMQISLQWPDLLSDRTVVTVVAIAALASRIGSGRLDRSLTDAAVVVLGVLYVGLTLGHLLLTRNLPEGSFLIFFIVLVTWAGDTGAYYAGKTFGRLRLAPRISPNKTIEGLVGGIALATAAALVARTWFLDAFSVLDALACGAGLTLVGVAGDLAESVLKRAAGVKDSGGLIPAHGGMLDRLDSMLFTAPAFYYYVTLVKG